MDVNDWTSGNRPRREDYATSDEWMNALLDTPAYVKTCPYERCNVVVGPYNTIGNLQQAMVTHVNWRHLRDNMIANEREYTSYRTRSPKARTVK